MSEHNVEIGTFDWALSLALARYCYGDREWSALDPEERNAIAEPYLPRARQIAPMVIGALEGGECPPDAHHWGSWERRLPQQPWPDGGVRSCSACGVVEQTIAREGAQPREKCQACREGVPSEIAACTCLIADEHPHTTPAQDAAS